MSEAKKNTANITMPTTLEEFLTLQELLMPARYTAVRFYAECAKRIPNDGSTIAEHFTVDELEALFEETGFDEDARRLYSWHSDHWREFLDVGTKLTLERFGPPSYLT